jgi:hypothetical protein
LSVTNVGADEGEYDNVAFETNNFLAPVWFSLVSREQFERYSERLMQTWGEVQPIINRPDAEELPEWQRFSEAVQWRIPWVESAKTLQINLPGVLACFPVLAGPVLEWLETLSSHVRRYPDALIHLELSQYFSFTGDPALFLRDIEQYVALWESPHPSQAYIWQGAADNAYRLIGEPVPWRDREDALPEPAPKPAAPSATGKRSAKWLQELYIWLLAILSAALGFAVYYKSSSVWLAALGFFVPSLLLILWHALFGPKRRSHRQEDAVSGRSADSPRKEKVTPSPDGIGIEPFNGPSPIQADGLTLVSPEDDPSLPNVIPWPQIRQAAAISPHELELALAVEQTDGAGLRLRLKLDERLEAKDAASAVNAIVATYALRANANDTGF